MPDGPGPPSACTSASAQALRCAAVESPGSSITCWIRKRSAVRPFRTTADSSIRAQASSTSSRSPAVHSSSAALSACSRAALLASGSAGGPCSSPSRQGVVESGLGRGPAAHLEGREIDVTGAGQLPHDALAVALAVDESDPGGVEKAEAAGGAGVAGVGGRWRHEEECRDRGYIAQIKDNSSNCAIYPLSLPFHACLPLIPAPAPGLDRASKGAKIIPQDHNFLSARDNAFIATG